MGDNTTDSCNRIKNIIKKGVCKNGHKSCHSLRRKGDTA